MFSFPLCNQTVSVHQEFIGRGCLGDHLRPGICLSSKSSEQWSFNLPAVVPDYVCSPGHHLPFFPGAGIGNWAFSGSRDLSGWHHPVGISGKLNLYIFVGCWSGKLCFIFGNFPDCKVFSLLPRMLYFFWSAWLVLPGRYGNRRNIWVLDDMEANGMC